MFIIQCSVQWEGCACFSLQSLSKHGGMRDKHMRIGVCHVQCPVLRTTESLSDIAVTSCSVSKKYYQDMGQRPTAQVVSKRRLV